MNKEQLKDFRKKYGLSQTELGKIIGRRQEAVSQYESGKYGVPFYVETVLEKWEQDNVNV